MGTYRAACAWQEGHAGVHLLSAAAGWCVLLWAFCSLPRAALHLLTAAPEAPASMCLNGRAVALQAVLGSVLISRYSFSLPKHLYHLELSGVVFLHLFILTDSLTVLQNSENQEWVWSWSQDSTDTTAVKINDLGNVRHFLRWKSLQPIDVKSKMY